MNQNLYIEYKGRQNDSSASENVRNGIIRSLLYFDIFNYPLTLSEIVLYSPVKFEELSIVESNLQELVEAFLIFRFGEFYSLQNNLSLIDRRIKGNKCAADIYEKAKQRSRYIQKFPFVKSVNISGSLSKNYFDESTDIDFFIIAQEKRIWICRMLLTLYKKIFLLNSRKYFCINYYVDNVQLEIPDKNLFSATEIITLKNQTGESYYKNFIEANMWVESYFPNFVSDYSYLYVEKSGFIKSTIENILKGKFGNLLDTAAFRITAFFIQKKYKNLVPNEKETNMRTQKHASKHHPQGFQFKVLKAFEEKRKDFEMKHDLSI